MLARQGLTLQPPSPLACPLLQGYVMLTRWLPDEPSTLPPNASHQVGVGACVINAQGLVLVVQERNGPLKGRQVRSVAGMCCAWQYSSPAAALRHCDAATVCKPADGSGHLNTVHA